MPDEILAWLYRDDDWATFSAGDPDFLAVGDIRVPYVVFENEDGAPTARPDPLAGRLKGALRRLWELQPAR